MLNVNELLRLPKHLKDGFTKIDEYDLKLEQAYEGIRKSQQSLYQHLINSNGSNKKTEKLSKDIEKFKIQGNNCCDEKFTLINKMYDLVDDRIKELDANFSKFESEIMDNEQENNKTSRKKKKYPITNQLLNQLKPRSKVSSMKQAVSRSKKNLLQKEKRKKENYQKKMREICDKNTKKKGATNEKKRQSTSSEGSKEFLTSDTVLKSLSNSNDRNIPASAAFVLSLTNNPNQVLDMPTDPYEPVYCVCSQVSYGDMIGCDNADCPIEWFHFQCVGITANPKGTWFCPRCKPLKSSTK